MFKAAVARYRADDRGPRDRRDLRRPKRATGARAMASAPSAQRIKQAVRERTGLTCSVGITPNKLLAEGRSELEQAGRTTLIIGTSTSRRESGRSPRARSTASAPRQKAEARGVGIETIGQIGASRSGFPAASTSGSSYRRLAARGLARDRRSSPS